VYSSLVYWWRFRTSITGANLSTCRATTSAVGESAWQHSAVAAAWPFEGLCRTAWQDFRWDIALTLSSMLWCLYNYIVYCTVLLYNGIFSAKFWHHLNNLQLRIYQGSYCGLVHGACWLFMSLLLPYLIHVTIIYITEWILGSFLVVLIVAALCNRAGHYIFALWFLSSIFFFFLT